MQGDVSALSITNTTTDIVTTIAPILGSRIATTLGAAGSVVGFVTSIIAFDQGGSETDFIFSAIAQELGLAGGAAVILLYLIFAYRGFRISMLAEDGFSKLLAAGLTAAVAIQAFIIIGGVIGLVPLTGITLPFVSYGGSSIVANFVVLALLLMISERVNRGGSA